MKKTITTLILAALCITALQAQNVTEKKVKEIRAEYTKLKKQIADMEKTKSSDVIYCMQLEDNVYDSRTAGERFYNDKTKFYYANNTDGERELRMVIQKIVYGNQTTYKEIMYIKGETAFVYEKEEGANNEKRLYKSDDKMIRYTENNVEKKYAEAEESIAMISKASATMQQIFDIVMRRD